VQGLGEVPLKKTIHKNIYTLLLNLSHCDSGNTLKEINKHICAAISLTSLTSSIPQPMVLMSNSPSTAIILPQQPSFAVKFPKPNYQEKDTIHQTLVKFKGNHALMYVKMNICVDHVMNLIMPDFERNS
jgi:hypothetical protein